MKKLFPFFLAAGLVIVLASPVYAYHCPADMHAIDAALAAGTQLSAADMDKVMELRVEGEALHKSGDHGASVKALGEAMMLLGLK